MNGQPDQPQAPREGLAADAPVEVTLADFVKQIASDTAYAVADKIIGIHMDSVHPIINSKLDQIGKQVDSLRMSRSKLIGIILGVSACNAIIFTLIVKVMGSGSPG